MQVATREIAEQFVRSQIGIIKKHGGTPKINDAKMEEILESTQASFESLCSRQTKK